MNPLRLALLAGCMFGIVGVTEAQPPEGRGPSARAAQYLTARPALGEPAPDFVLGDLDGKEVRLKDFAGKRPVVIEFGSYT